jgi:zinc protease
VAFRAPAFSDRAKDPAALALLMNLAFGPTSALYKRLVEDEQRVDRMFSYLPDSVDPNLATIAARVKDPADAVMVRDAILQTVARLRAEPVPRKALADAISSARYGLIASLDTTERIAATVASYAHFERSYATINRYHALFDRLSPDDLRDAARRHFTDAGLVVSTLSHTPLPAAMATLPTLASLAPRADAGQVQVLVQPSALPQIRFKLLFPAGSAHDPKGRSGLAALAAAMVSNAGSTERGIADIKQALFPLAGSFSSQVDKEMTTFTGTIHRDRWAEFIDVVLPQLVTPGLRDEDFKRLKDSQLNTLQQDLRNNDEEELAKERLQANVYAGTPYGHPVLGTEAGLKAITLHDVREFQARAYTAGAVRVALSGAVTDEMSAALRVAVARLPAGPGLPPTTAPAGRMPQGIEVEIIEKETRATALSFGLPIVVTRSHSDFVALSVVRSWLGEHRHSMSHLYQRIREERGMNYGNYAYMEAFPNSGYKTFPDANVARRAQLFEVWIRPVTTPENAHFALRVALSEIDRLLTEGMTAAQFEQTREFLEKYVLLMASSQDVQLGGALDAAWFGTPDFARLMRDGLARLTLADVNAAMRRHLSARQLSVVFVTQKAAELKQRLIDDTVATISYDGNKPAALLAEDRLFGARPLAIGREAVRITPAAQVFAD